MSPRRGVLASVCGFTLLEMLVALALTAMIAGVLWQAMHQVSRVEGLLQRSGLDGQLDLVKREWLRSLLQGALVEQIGAPRQFVGDARQLNLVSSESLALPGLQGPRLQLRLERDSANRRERLVVAEVSEARQASTRSPVRVELFGWSGKDGGFRYLDADGQWVDQWPPAKSRFQLTGDPDLDLRREAQAALPSLPRAVWVEIGAEMGGAMVAEIATTQPGRPRLANWEQR